MKLKMLPAILLGSVLCASAIPSLASDNQRDNQLEINIGLGATHQQSLYKGVGTRTEVLPVIDVQYGSFFFQSMEDIEAGYVFLENDSLLLYASVASDSLDGERNKNSQLRDMGDVDSGVNLKLGGALFTNYGYLEASIAQDVSNEHEGAEARLSWSTPLEFSSMTITPTIHAAWMSSKLLNHYYGVKTSQVKAGRAAYAPGSGYRYGAGVSVEYPLNKQWALIGGVDVELFSSEIEDSPIVDDDKAFSGFVALNYNWK